jgi:hypothetical protein
MAQRTHRRHLLLSVVLGLGAVGAASITAILVSQDGGSPLPAALQVLQPSLQRNGCSGPEVFAEEERRHLQPGATYDDYRTEAPTSGSHAPAPLPGNPAVLSRQPPKEALVHNLEHGYVVLWHRDASPGDRALTRVAEASTNLLVTPLADATLPGGARVAVTTWRSRLLCQTVDAQLVQGLVNDYLGAGALAPEPDGA